ncbi:MAG: hypothetical protein WDA41_10135 [Candidatus Neomarinimicrobiota bacterium]|jgi:hypothetical protein
MSTKEQVLSAARQKYRRQEVELAAGVTVVLRELAVSEKRALDQRLYECNAQGEPQDDPDGQGFLLRKGIKFTEEWLAATMEPAMTVEELVGDDWPESLKAQLMREALKVNGFSVQDAVKNS